MIEPKIDEIFEYEGLQFKCIINLDCETCTRCDLGFLGLSCLNCKNHERQDNNHVSFIKIDDSMYSKVRCMSRIELEKLCIEQYNKANKKSGL